MNMKRRFAIIMMVFMLGILTACQSQESGGADKNKEKGAEKEETVTLKVARLNAEDDAEDWENRVGRLEERLPNIEIEPVSYENTSEHLQELFAAGVKPDVIIGPIEPLKELEVIEPLDELIEKHDFDLDLLNPTLVKTARSLSDEGTIVGFPDNKTFFALYYNKDIFDLFGVPYPDPDKPMTWEETIELAGKMTGERNGVEYVGLTHGPFAGFGPGDYPFREIAVNLTDPETGETDIQNNAELKKYFDLMKEYYNIPNVHDPEREGDWFLEGKAGMYLAQGNYLEQIEDETVLESFDMVPIPVWEDNPVGLFNSFWTLTITNYSEHKDEAFQLLEEYVSEEHQLHVSESGEMGSVLSDLKLDEKYAIESPAYKDKNRKAFFTSESATYEGTISTWDEYVDVGEAIEEMADSEKDVNTLLRELDEKSAAKIKEAMGSNN
ncbi:ABC transporter substrate-binding protein [Bacillus sp. SD088]|uniref:ABC transporter substrate-binding protein n=1 Tax=Bacillus sp. SD088 TaxID=2782012 RepID=UPI001A97C031|nr:extracellular solute-binding protein [Bacillus sp. SD088]MBO0995797.1 extracellular solute-binding protein [Bacillus sp. SD088]